MIREVTYSVAFRPISSRMPQKVVPQHEAGVAKTIVFPWLLAHAEEHKTPQALIEAAVARGTIPPSYLANEKHWIWPLARKAKRAGKPQPGMAWIVSHQHGFDGAARMAADARKKAQREMAFDQLTRAFGPGPLAPAAPGALQVTVIRWSMGQLDSTTESLRSAFKYIVDSIAFWAQHGMAATARPNWTRILGHGDELIAWDYRQDTAPRGVNAITIRIDDGLPGEDIIVGERPRRLSPQEKKAAAKAQALLPAAPPPVAPAAPVVLPVLVALPWEQDAADPTSIDWHDADDVVGRRLLRSIEHRGYPMHFDVKHPKTGRAHKLLRTEVEHPEAERTDRVWLYEAGKITPETPSVIKGRDRTKNARRA